MIDITNILRLAGDGYGAHDIHRFTRVPLRVIQRACKEAGVELSVTSKSTKTIVTVVKSPPQQEAESRYQAKKAAQYATPERAIPIPKEKPNPLDVAARVPGGRLVVKESGFWLDNQPASMDTVMRAGNAALKRHGLEQVGVQRWRVE